ncbi:MAG TPA: S9 family peptidase [Bryobacteraceae bacterium]|nr:S9 family peptidase [Bryobacteraceae bacterium]
MRRLFLAFLAIIAFTFPAVAQGKHPFTFEDMMKLKRVGEPEVSPDGKWVIFSVVDVNLEANTKTPHIWIVPTAGGQEREIIADQDADRPRWAPDGKRFAFISTKKDGSQIWIADFDGGSGTVTAARQLTMISTEASGELWSPDGKNILFVSDVYPDCIFRDEGEYFCNQGKVELANKSKVKAQIFDHLLYRHWNSYKEGKRTHILVISVEALIRASNSSAQFNPTALPRDLTPGDYDAPVFSLGGQDNYAFSPDGQEICYTSNHDKNEAASTNNDLWIVPVNGGQAKNITADNPASDSTPLYSPDGRYIAYRAQQRPGYESDRFRLMLYDRKTGEKRNLTEDFDQWVGSFVWSNYSGSWDRLYFVSESHGDAAIHKAYAGPRPSKILGETAFGMGAVQGLGQGSGVVGGFLADKFGLRIIPKKGAGYDDDLAVTPDGKRVLFTEMSIYAPTEIYSRDLNESSGPVLHPVGTQITHINDEVLSHIDMLDDALSLPQLVTSNVGSFWFAGAHNDNVEGFLVKPPKFDAGKKYPVKFLIHGGPQGAWGDDWSYRWNPELFAANGYVVIMINFHGSTGYGQKFIDAINGDWGGAPFEDLMKGLDYAEQTYPFIDKTRECALGASYGGYAINWILGHTDRFKCLVSHDGMFNAESAWGTTEELWFNDWEFKGTPYDNRASYEKWSPHQYAKNFKTPTLVIHGQRDYRLDVSEGLQLFTTLQMEGVPSKMLYFPDEGHWVMKPQNSQLWYKTVNDWVDQWTKDQGTK